VSIYGRLRSSCQGAGVDDVEHIEGEETEEDDNVDGESEDNEEDGEEVVTQEVTVFDKEEGAGPEEACNCCCKDLFALFLEFLPLPPPLPTTVLPRLLLLLCLGGVVEVFREREVVLF